MAMRYCKDCQLYECSIRTPLGGCEGPSPAYIPFVPQVIPEREVITDCDWSTFRREAAKDILCAVLAGGIANGAKGFDAQKEELVNVSIGVADELIKQLREEKK